MGSSFKHAKGAPKIHNFQVAEVFPFSDAAQPVLVEPRCDRSCDIRTDKNKCSQVTIESQFLLPITECLKVRNFLLLKL